MAIDDEVIPKDEAHLIENVFEFANLEVRNVMTPRINLFALPKDISFSKLLFECKRNRHSKIPIYRNTPDDIIGVIYLKELIPYYFIDKKDRKNIDINDFIKDVYFVPERKDLKELLQEFIKKKIGFAVVVDEYGGTEGIVSLNDCIEQILGKFIDQDEEQSSRMVSKITENKYIVSGECSISDIHKFLGVDIEDEDSETIAGYVLKRFDKIPNEGEKISDNQCEYEIKDVSQNKIEQILVTINDYRYTN
jgi:CBS domain containing-hemolysin-like protein